MKTLKINLVAFIALFIGVATMSFKAVDSMVSKEQQELIWYTKDQVSGDWERHGPNVGPPVPCPGASLNPCAKGFIEEPDEEVTDDTDAQDERFFN